ncbi:MAG: hypothetical protein M0P91_04430 [Sulfuricurvum sp.]|jgi:DNA mismatch repair protein MutS|uniref:hypothetical protein n=1 Tax=Sulfuricurvum sp. TaxID=2025608 RepID=UPI0025F15C94|nr:hypothetical protein [Sulfuricurvum sp.]MCK9372421.1 hypothetical protein [Sulfuricurvum sp.]
MNTDEIGALLQDKSKLLSETYFELQAACEAKYGPDTLVIIEVGSFFEVYEVNNEEMKIGKAKEKNNIHNHLSVYRSKPHTIGFLSLFL